MKIVDVVSGMSFDGIDRDAHLRFIDTTGKSVVEAFPLGYRIARCIQDDTDLWRVTRGIWRFPVGMLVQSRRDVTTMTYRVRRHRSPLHRGKAANIVKTIKLCDVVGFFEIVAVGRDQPAGYGRWTDKTSGRYF